MNLSDDIKPISYLKNNTATVINSINNNKRPVFITQNGEAKVVVQDIKSYENLQNTLSLLKMINQAEKDIFDKNIITQDLLFKDLNKLI